MANHKYLTENERVKLEYMLRKKISKKEIAAELNCCLATVYNEIKRGEYEHTLNSITGKTEKRYSEYKAQLKHNENLAAKGAGIKIAKDLNLAEFIEKKMVDEKFSAEAVLLYIKTHPDECKFNVEIKSVNTIYSYIDRGLFERLTRFHLPQRFRKYKPKKTVVRVNTKLKKKRTIEERPKEIESRATIGDWEMDTVKSSKKIKASVLVLTERKTRIEIIEPLKQGTIKEVVKALNKIERTVGVEFTKIFRTVTTDNGSEFKNARMLEKSCIVKGKRFEHYYCHSYSSWERGSNENNNKLIRRFIPKGKNIGEYTRDEIKKIQTWINNYPRKMFDGKSSRDLLEEELLRLGIDININIA